MFVPLNELVNLGLFASEIENCSSIASYNVDFLATGVRWEDLRRLK